VNGWFWVGVGITVLFWGIVFLLAWIDLKSRDNWQ
jgi:hypothetical protein